MVRPGRPAFDLSGRSFVTVWDFMGQELGLKGVDLVVYARIFGFHQADRDYYERLIEETDPCAEAVRIGSKCYRPAYGPLAEARVLPTGSEGTADAASSPHGESSGAWRGASEEAADPEAACSEEPAEPPLRDVHPISKTDNRFFG